MSVFSTRAGVLRLLIATCVMGFALLFGGKAQAGVEYVKVCSLYGAGFYYVPGTDTCIKLGGYLRVEHPVQAGNGFLCDNSYVTNNRGCQRNDKTVDVRQCTDYGTLRAYVQYAGFCASPGGGGVVSGGNGWAWGGFEGGFGTYGGSLTTLDQITLGRRDLLSPDNSVNLSGTTGRIGLAGGSEWFIGSGFEHRWFAGWQASADYEIGNLNTIHGFPGAQAFGTGGTDSFTLSKPWEFSIGPRAGVVLNGFNLYGSAGVSVAQLNLTANCGTGLCLLNGIPMFENSASTVHTGWYVSGGINTDYFTKNWGDGNWRSGIEIRYTDYGWVNIATGNPTTAQWNVGWKVQEFSTMFRIMHRTYIP
jgi:hypothetical protein